VIQSSSEKIKKIKKLLKIDVGPEDDLKTKIVLPFFKIIGYTDDLYEIGFPIEAYNLKKGRKPSADIAFFSSPIHNSNTSLLVVEVKKEKQKPPLLQAKFYADNLNVPFFITWEAFEFQVFQKSPFRGPVLLKSYNLERMKNADLSEMINFFSPKAIQIFCEKNNIEKNDLNEKKMMVEHEYLKNLSIELKKFKIFDLSRTQNLEKSYIPLYIQKFGKSQIIEFKIEDEIKHGIHPQQFEERIRETKQPLIINRVIENLTKIAIIGDPGAGKTTLLKKICLEHCDPIKKQFPIFIAIRDNIALGHSLIESIHRQIKRYGRIDDPEMIFDKILDEGRLVLCVDGLDELDISEPDEGRKALRILCEELSDLMVKNSKNIFILSARRESWPTCRPETPPDFVEYEILPFSQHDIRKFITKWFAQSDYDQSKSLIDEFRLNGWPEFATNPLLLSCICVVYENHGRLPDRISSLCGKSIDALLEKWDATRRISRRGTISELSAERKMDILIELAFAFHNKKIACFSRSDVISELELLLPKIGLRSSDAGTIFDEISTQHGLIKSWSMNELYSFPHLIFQEYFTAKALSRRAEGYQILLNKKDDSFWNNVFLMYSEIQDATKLLEMLLDSKDNILNSHLFLASKCLRRATTVTDISIRKKILSSLMELSVSKNVFMQQKAIDHLALIGSEESNNFLLSQIRLKNHKIDPASYATKYLIKIEGDRVVEEIISLLKSYKFELEDLLHSLIWLPQEKALPLLKDLIETYDYPGENITVGRDDENRWRRIWAAEVLAEIGQEEAIPLLTSFINSNTYSSFVRANFIQILTTIRSPQVPIILDKIIKDKNQPIYCQITAAEKLAPNNHEAKSFLISIISKPLGNDYTYRDAISALIKFDLNESDIAYFVPHLNNVNTKFWGAQAHAIEALEKIGTLDVVKRLTEAQKLWTKSNHKQKNLVIQKILFTISLIDKNKTAKFLRNCYSTNEKTRKDKNKILAFSDMPRMIQKYYSVNEKEALEFYIEILNSDTAMLNNFSIASSIIQALPSFHSYEKLIEPAIKLIYLHRVDHPLNEMRYWKILNEIWERSDLDKTQKELFFKEWDKNFKKIDEQRRGLMIL